MWQRVAKNEPRICVGEAVTYEPVSRQLVHESNSSLHVSRSLPNRRSFAIIGELLKAYENFHAEIHHAAWFALVRILIWVVGFMVYLKVRRKAAQLSPAELSKFLCNTIAMATMIFFIFETVSCFTTNGLESVHSSITAFASLHDSKSRTRAKQLLRQTDPNPRLYLSPSSYFASCPPRSRSVLPS